MFSDELQALAGKVVQTCKARGVMVVTAESCTGGLIAGCLTEVAGASAVVDRGFVTYHNDAKRDVLGVDQALLDTVGAVSEDVARAMAEGALGASRADIAVSCTGIAGPGGATPGKPVGLVHMALARRGAPTQHHRMAYGDIGRDLVRLNTVRDALRMILDNTGDTEGNAA
ncbi:MAG: CinA family protein [Proteobacteria bacterium]|nr:CinA family protein [Pseudomonadota bacterium]MDA1058637.1 CinA family protein [Pseudomonadota bacterium]